MTIIAVAILGFLLGRLAGGFSACARCERRHLAELEITEKRWAAVVEEDREFERFLIECAGEANQAAFESRIVNEYLLAARRNVGGGVN